jgi:hypothetical protein
VIQNYIFEQEYVEREEYNWHSELPNILIVKMAPNCWIWNTNGWNISDAKKRFSGFLSEYSNAIISQDPITDCTVLMELYESQIPRITGDSQITILIHYFLYNFCLPKERRAKLFDALKDDPKNINLLRSCKIETLIFLLITGQEWCYDLSDCIKTYQKYQKNKFQSNSIVLPQIFELLILVKIANECFEQGHYEEYYQWITLAYLESAGQSDIQDLFNRKFSYGELIDINSVCALIFSPKKPV